MRLSKLMIAAATMTLLAACTGPIVLGGGPVEDGVTVPLYACPENAVWDGGKRLIDAGMTDKLELKGEQFDRLQKIWEKVGGEPERPDSFFLFKQPGGDVTVIIVVFARCVVGEEAVPTEALLSLLTGRQPIRGRSA